MKRNVLMSLVAAVAILCGCSDQSTKIVLDTAKAAATPEAAYEIIVAAEEAYCRGQFNCKLPAELLDADDAYFAAAAKAGAPKILLTLYLSRGGKLAADLKQVTLERAASSNDPDMLLVAASILGNSNLGPINDDLQIAFLKRAWDAGNKQAAGLLANSYARSKDYETAYYWSLRCNSGCERNDIQGFRKSGYDYTLDTTSLGELEKHLNHETIARLQNDASVGELGKYLTPEAAAKIGLKQTKATH